MVLAAIRVLVEIRDSSNKPLIHTVFDPGTREHTYGMEVKGNTLKVFVDREQALETTDNQYLTGTQVGMKSYDTQIAVTAFRVIAV